MDIMNDFQVRVEQDDTNVAQRATMKRRLTSMAVAAVAVITIASSAALIPQENKAAQSLAGPSSAVSVPADTTIKISSEAEAELNRRTSTPEGQEAVLQELQKAFAGVAKIKLATEAPKVTVAAPVGAAGMQVRTAGYTGTQAPAAVPAFADGITGTHFWLTMSYADAISGGAIGTAVAACSATWWLIGICGGVGVVLSGLVQGWPRVSNHGVWLEVYRSPWHIRAGRW
ncbi:hypothetical protein AB4Y86_09000 [Arthrobacter sp. 2YAF22_2]|uniref:hypothetical protein n=1 Tax=Arthrobacter sp. 2YAF22_2 TaxID=3233029 RepID=UPI003F8E965B